MGERDTSDTKAPPEWRSVFIDAYKDRGTVKDACLIAGISRQTAYRHRLEDPEFAEEWDSVQHDIVVVLEASALQRAEEGSERMIEFLLKANRPQKYRDTLKIDGKLAIASEAELDDEIASFLEREAEERTNARGDEPAGEGQAEGSVGVAGVGRENGAHPAAPTD